MNRLAAAYLDPTTNAGTARWVGLGVLAFDLASRGASGWNVAGLLILGGLEGVARILAGQDPGGPFKPFKLGATA